MKRTNEKKDMSKEIAAMVDKCLAAEGYLVFVATLAEDKINYYYIKQDFRNADILRAAKSFKDHCYRDLEGDK